LHLIGYHEDTRGNAISIAKKGTIPAMRARQTQMAISIQQIRDNSTK
jgi:hypothetical protein